MDSLLSAGEPWTVDPKAPNALKELGRQAEFCSGCNKTRHELGDASLQRCSRCHSVLYCSPTCQTSHWHAAHKAVCRQRARDREVMHDMVPTPSFVDEWAQWSRTSNAVLGRLVIIMMQDAAAARGVAPEVIGKTCCVFINAEYTPGTRLPFQIADDYSVVSFDELLDARGGDVDKQMQETVQGLKETAGGVADGDALILTTLVAVSRITRVIRHKTAPELLHLKMEGHQLSAREIVRILNDGFGGAGTTKPSASNRPVVEGNMVEFLAKIKAEQRKFSLEAGETYNEFVLNAVRMYGMPSELSRGFL